MTRRLTFSVFRHNPRDPASLPHQETYSLDEQPGMTLFIALSQRRDAHDPSLNFDVVCRAWVCGSGALALY